MQLVSAIDFSEWAQIQCSKVLQQCPSVPGNEGCQVWPFRGKKNKFGLFKKLVGFKIFGNLLSSCLFLSQQKFIYSQIQNFSFLKTEFGTFQLQAPGNPAGNIDK